MKNIAKNGLGVINVLTFQESAQDCIMAAVCSNHDLPEVLNDMGKKMASNISIEWKDM